jgi:acetolactate decarboxylase
MKLTAKPLYRNCLLAFLICCSTGIFAQNNNRNLFSAGHAGAFVDGLYDAYYPYKQLETKGDFGLGAPAKLDGELMVFNGKFYQAQSTGITRQIADTGKTPYAVVCFFHADKVFKPARPLNKAELFKYLDSVINDQNGLYAIHITGTYHLVKTRAFPPVTQKPYTPIAAMLDKQAFFNFNDIKGDLIGFKTPEFMAGPFISGYHFHFLSDDKDKGGHMVDILTNDITIEVETLTSFTLDLPQTADFKNYNFKKDNRADIKSVENGKK